jgi:flagellar motor switch protein FliG
MREETELLMNPALRKAAILVAALEPSAADRLLDQMSEQQAALVRSAAMQLDDVDAAEQEAILAEFFGHPSASDSEGVELAISAHESRPTTSPSFNGKSQEPRFALLQELPVAELAQRLRTEHPQLIALVTSYLTAHRAARLLEALPGRLRDEVLDRLEDLDDANPEVLADLEREFERVFTTYTRPRSPRQLAHVQAILQHLQPGGKSESHATASTVADRPSRGTPHEAPAIPFEQLLSLSAQDFFAVFEEADPRVVMLALAGAPRRVFERYLAQFSNERAMEFERHLEQLRPLRLRDVEEAQRQLAILAGKRLPAARAAAESSRRFAAAA